MACMTSKRVLTLHPRRARLTCQRAMPGGLPVAANLRLELPAPRPKVPQPGPQRRNCPPPPSQPPLPDTFA
eukprot:3078403-Rhodomonas_salina.1